MSLFKIEVITASEKIYTLMDALRKNGNRGATVSDVLGFGAQNGTFEFENEDKAGVRLLPKKKISLIVEYEEYEKFIDLIKKELYTGHIGDGKIFVTQMYDVIRVRTGETGTLALQ